MKNFYERVASLTGLETAQLSKLSLGELSQNIILPDICFKNSQCVSEEFVMFMSEFGYEIYKQNAFHGEGLYDMALQHIFKDGCCFDLPTIYREACLRMEYSYGLRSIGKAEFSFLKAQAPHLLSKKETSNLLFTHAEKIIFQILENITPEGHLLKDTLCKEGITPRELRKFAEEMCSIAFGFQRVYNQLASPDKWKIWPQFFLEHANEIRWGKFAAQIGSSDLFFPGKKCRKMIEDYVSKKSSV